MIWMRIELRVQNNLRLVFGGAVRAGCLLWSKLARMLDALEFRAQDNPWLMQTVAVLRELLAQRDQARLEKELIYSSHSLSSRLTEQDELLSFSQQRESEKAAFLRRKVQQGRDSGAGR